VVNNFGSFALGGNFNFVTMQNTLIFVYNANEDYFSQVTDYLHKVFRPETYACNLCSLTHTNFGMKSDFKKFIQSFEDLEFMHKDQFYRKFTEHNGDSLPAIYVQNATEKNKLEVLVSHVEINKINDLNELQLIIKTRFNAE
jgi:hypothetical protein